MTRRLRLLSVLVAVVLAAMGTLFAVIAHNVVRDQERRLLHERAAEVGTILTNRFSGVDATLRSLAAVVQPGEDEQQPFVESAGPLVVGDARAIVLVRIEGAGFERVALVGDGVPDGPIAGDRLALLRRAAEEPGLVTGLVTDGLRQRVGMAVGPITGRPGWIVYRESAIDPNAPNAATGSSAFHELEVALYASDTPRPESLVLATTREQPSGPGTATAPVPVGVDHWLVAVRSRQPLVGALAERVPWILLGGGVISAVLAAAVVEVVGRRRDFALALVDERTTALQATVEDLEAAQIELIRHAYHDGLTGLPNRPLFLDRVDHALRRGSRTRGVLAVMFLDLDHFKWINDSLGHAAGDRLLVAVADRLSGAVRPGDTVARLGGDEFVVLCEGLTDEDEVAAIAARLRLAVAGSFDLGDHEIRLTASVGVATTAAGDAADAADADALVRDADLAMYLAKDKGRDRVELFDEPLRLHAVHRHETESALRLAIERGEFVLHYQPVVDLARGSVVGIEALVRWNDPRRGLVAPGEFVGIAEDTGLIRSIGSYVLAEACQWTAAWHASHQDAPRLSVSVNLSPRQLDFAGLPAEVASVLESTGLDPALHGLEITESALAEDTDAAQGALRRLRELGVTIVVDDFGTGYSSLLSLRHFPVDVLKVDRSFVRGLGDSDEDTAIVSGVVGLAKALGLSAVAEGVETWAQADRLTALGCELAQGFHWSPALAPDELASWLSAHAPPGPAASGRRPGG